MILKKQKNFLSLGVPFLFLLLIVLIKPCFGITINLNPGWNLVGIPFLPQAEYYASDLAEDIQEQGGQCWIIQQWKGGQWDPFTPGVGKGFAIQRGIGYFIYLESASQLVIQDETPSCVDISLQQGWNLISIPNVSQSDYYVSDLADDIQEQGGECLIIQQWKGGRWNPYCPGSGFAFAVHPEEGYFVYCTTGSALKVCPLPEVSLVSDKETYTIGETVRIEVQIQNAVDLYGSPFHFIFDSERLEMKQVAEGDFLNSDGTPTIFVTHINYLIRDSKPVGELVLGLNRVGDVNGASGDGLLVSVEFKAKASGQVNFLFESAVLQNSSGQQRDANWNDKTISIW